LKKIILIVSSFFIFVAFNYSIYQKEQIKAEGEIVLLELAPVDPRSLIQGDYMRLSYKIAQNLRSNSSKGYIVLRLNADKVATFYRFYEGGELNKGEKLLPYEAVYEQIKIFPDSFLFQEGHAQDYQKARYGVFKFTADNQNMLIGVADEKFKLIKPS
jgi:uncharacterized membrane-anchored protein